MEGNGAAGGATDVDGAEEEGGTRSGSGGKGFTLFWSDANIPSRIIVSKPSGEFFTCSSIYKGGCHETTVFDPHGQWKLTSWYTVRIAPYLPILSQSSKISISTSLNSIASQMLSE